MSITFEAVYEDGVLKPAAPLPLKEHDKVRLILEREDEAVRRVRESYGRLRWVGDPEVLRRLAEDPEFGSLESR